eukprot:jgi/Tetstr1/444212/TSEL_032105.t1
MMEAALNLCEWKLKHNIKMAAFGRLSKLLKKLMLPKDGSKLAETLYHMKQCLKDMRPKIKKMDMRMALVARTSDFGTFVRPMLPSAGTRDVVCAN